MELRLLSAVCIAIFISSNAAMAVSFTPLGYLPGGGFTSFARAVSADSSVFVGESDSASAGDWGSEAFRWTHEGGMEGLGYLPGGASSFAEDVSADGSVVVGASATAPWTQNGEAFRWTREGGMESLGNLPGGWFGGGALGVSADGSVVVGVSNSALGAEAFRWTREDGMVGLGDLPGGAYASEAWDVSADGSVVVGVIYSYLESGLSGLEAFRWTREDGMEGLGDLPGGWFGSEAHGVSADGSVVIGKSSSALGAEAFRWTREDGMVGLGDLPGGGFYSDAWDVSADGSVVVGHGTSASGGEAFRWTREDGMQSVAWILTTAGVDLTGWILDYASGVSADGYTIVGWGWNPDGFHEAWIADLSPEGLLEATIDIKPGNKQNVINPRSKGGIWVAILSDTDPESPFDPSSRVDITTVEFGPEGAKAIRHKVKDINKDGLGDLLLRFKIPETGIECGDTEATLIGETFDGVHFTGTDSIKTVGCEPKKCNKKKHHYKHRDDDEKHHGRHKEKDHHDRHHSKYNDHDRDDDHKKL